MVSIKIGNKNISKKSDCFIIAEAGVNHNGRLSLALKLVDLAAKAGADAVKFQTFQAEQVVTAKGEMAEYQKKNTGKNEPQIKMIKRLELNEKFYKPIIGRCKKRGILFLSTPHGHIKSANFLQKLGMLAFKIGSGDLTNKPLLEHVAKFGKPVILGTGMATLHEVKNAVNWIKKAGNKKIIILHSTTNYPCPQEEVNLRAMQTMMKKMSRYFVGYSDHTIGSFASIIAVALGAKVLEKHITLNKNLPGPDHKASSSPNEFKGTVKAIRNVNRILGLSLKKPTKSELTLMPIIRKSLVAGKKIKKSECFSFKNLTVKRPGTGLKPEMIYKIIGKTAKKEILPDELIKQSFIA